MINNFTKLHIILFIFSICIAIPLQDIYDQATAEFGYDKYLVLDSETIYTGGIGIYEGDVYLNCNGAIIDLQDGQGIWVYADEYFPSSLDIEYCSVVNGLYYGLSYGGLSLGNINNCNFVDTNFGLKLFDNANVYITNSIFSLNQSMGIGVYTEIPILDASYLLFWDNEDDCLENCPGWGSIWTQLELIPGYGIINENPLFIDASNNNFELVSSSPCINSGNPNLIDSDGSISDIGANTFYLNK